MINALIAAAVSVIIAIVTPAVLIAPSENTPQEPLLLIKEQSGAETEDETVWVKDGQGILELPMEEYLVGVVFSEMPASFHIEALKAQAVAARTFAYAGLEGGKHEDCTVCADSACCQSWSSSETMKEKLGDAYETCYEKVKTAVLSTKGQVLTYNGSLIEAVYFSCSGGRTEAAAAVWGSEVPYLQSVESDGEENAFRYESEKAFSLAEFKEILKSIENGMVFEGDPGTWVGISQYTEGGGVAQIEICGKSFTGTQMRSIFGLNSTEFKIEIYGDRAIFYVRGFGHRVGMSQYGANAMAQDGNDYQTILKHYYQGVNIEN